MEQELCDNYGRQCELLTPWRGYHRGTIVGMNGYRYVVQFSSGAEIEVLRVRQQENFPPTPLKNLQDQRLKDFLARFED